MTPSRGIEPGPHWWEASALTTAPSLDVKFLPILISLDIKADKLQSDFFLRERNKNNVVFLHDGRRSLFTQRGNPPTAKD